MTLTQSEVDWRSAWLDAVAFLSVLAIAWWTRARAADLVWSLWLSSLVVGYAIILWAIFRLPLQVAVGAWRDRGLVAEGLARNGPVTNLVVALVGLLILLFALAFFTLHFVGFHYVHAGLLSYFFPMTDAWGGGSSPWSRDLAIYREVARRYWVYLPAAFLAERTAFLRPPASGLTMLPYQKVMRMHALIFFFAFAHFAGLDNFAVYTVVYAVYFFPWRFITASRAVAAAPA